MSKLDEPIRTRFDQAGSRLDQPIGIQDQRDRDMFQKDVNRYMQEDKREERVFRRGYRDAMRSNSPQAKFQALAALQNMRDRRGTTGAGIRSAGSREKGVKDNWENKKAELDRLQQTREQGVVGRAEDGHPVYNTLEASGRNSGEWVDVGGGGSQQPVGTLERQAERPGETVGAPRRNLIAENRRAFYDQVKGSESVNSGDPEAIERAMARGEQMGLIREQMQETFGWQTDTEREAQRLEAEAAPYQPTFDKGFDEKLPENTRKFLERKKKDKLK